MSAAGIIGEVGGFLFLGAALAVSREAVKRNWVRLSVSFAVTAPDARWPKPRTEEKQALPEPVSEPAPLSAVTESKKGAAA